MGSAKPLLISHGTATMHAPAAALAYLVKSAILLLRAICRACCCASIRMKVI